MVYQAERPNFRPVSANTRRERRDFEDLPADKALNVVKLISAIKRQKTLLLIGALLGLALGALYLLFATPRFNAAALLLIEPGRSRTQDSGQVAAAATPIDAAEVDSKIEVISSDKIIQTMIASLSSDDQAKLARTLELLSSSLTTRLFGRSSRSETDPVKVTDFSPELVRSFLTVSRVEHTYVVKIAFTSSDPMLAATVANAFTEAYRQAQRDQWLADAKNRVAWFQQRIDETQAQSTKANLDIETFRLSSEVGESDVRKRELTLKAENLRKLYQSLLLRQQQAVDDETFPQNGAQVITPATPPTIRTYPKKSFTLFVALILGMGAGAALGTLRELLDNSLRTGADVAELGGAPFLGIVPMIKAEQHTSFKQRTRDTTRSIIGAATVFPNYGRVEVNPQVQARDSLGSPFADPVIFQDSDPVARHSVDHPLSRFAETLRAIRAAANLLSPRESSKVIGVASALPGEGKTMLSINLARLLASEGAAVLLIDGDSRNRGLSKHLAPNARYGLNEAVRDVDVSSGDMIFSHLLEDDVTGARLLPILSGRSSHDVRRSQNLEALLAETRNRFQYIIVDFPPLAAVSDARTIAALVDCFVLVAAWGDTPKGVVQKLIYTEDVIADRLLGVVLNKVDLNKFRGFERKDDPQYHYFREYFTEHSAPSSQDY